MTGATAETSPVRFAASSTPSVPTTGKPIARRNLLWSIVAEHIGFSVWLLWSVVATRLPKVGFTYSTEQLFSLVALPGLIGALVWISPLYPMSLFRDTSRPLYDTRPSVTECS